MNKQFRQGMGILLGLTLVPAVLVGSLFLGQEPVNSGLINGTIAYTWLLLALYTSSKPAWLMALTNRQHLVNAQFSLLMASLPLIWSHQLTSSGNSFISLTGIWAMVALGASLIYAFLTALSQVFKPSLVTSRHQIGLQRLNALATAITFAHAHSYASSTNLVFMTLLYLLTGLAFYSYLTKPTRQEETNTSVSSI